MSDWQPIETAPKDGTVVLIYEYPFGPATARFLDDRGFWYLTAGDDLAFSFEADLIAARPTHWMILPDPPKDT